MGECKNKKKYKCTISSITIRFRGGAIRYKNINNKQKILMIKGFDW